MTDTSVEGMHNAAGSLMKEGMRGDAFILTPFSFSLSFFDFCPGRLLFDVPGRFHRHRACTIQMEWNRSAGKISKPFILREQ